MIPVEKLFIGIALLTLVIFGAVLAAGWLVVAIYRKWRGKR